MKGFAGFGCGLAAGLAAVRLVIEIPKEDDEGEGVSDQTPVHPLREQAVGVQRQSRVADGDVKLDLREKIHITDELSEVELEKLNLFNIHYHSKYWGWYVFNAHLLIKNTITVIL